MLGILLIHQCVVEICGDSGCDCTSMITLLIGSIIRAISLMSSSLDNLCNSNSTLIVELYSSRHVDSLLPVLNHGPRSLLYVQVQGLKTYVRNESNS